MRKTSKSLMDLIEVAVKRHGGASSRRLADIAQQAGHDVSHNTLNRLRQGTYASRPADASVRAIAYLAEVPETVAFAAVGVRPPATEHYQVPDVAQRMNTQQRKALDALLRAFVVQPRIPAMPSLGALLSARDQLEAALADSAAAAPIAMAARAVIAAIDETTVALFNTAGDDTDITDDDVPPANGAASVACTVN